MADIKPIIPPLEELLPEKIVKNINVIRASHFYGRLLLVFENGYVVRSELVVTEIHNEQGRKKCKVDGA